MLGYTNLFSPDNYENNNKIIHKNFYFITSTFTTFTSLVALPISITSATKALCDQCRNYKVWVNYWKEKKRKHDKIVLLGKTSLNTIEVLISKALINSDVSHDECVSVNNILTEYNEMKEEIKNHETSV